MAEQHSHSQAPAGMAGVGAGVPAPGVPKKKPPAGGAAGVVVVVAGAMVNGEDAAEAGVMVKGEAVVGTVVDPKVRPGAAVVGVAVVEGVEEG